MLTMQMQSHHFLLSQKPISLIRSGFSVTTATSARVPVATSMYDRLAVRENASVDEIKAAFRKLARKLHPDTCRSSEDKVYVTQRFVQAVEAYRVLSDPVLREDYDLTKEKEKGKMFGNWESQLEGLRRKSCSRVIARRMKAATAAPNESVQSDL